MTVDDFVRSILANGKCNAFRTILAEARRKGFSRRELLTALEEDPDTEVHGTHQGGCWRKSR